MGGRQIGPPHIVGPRQVGPPVAGAIEAGVERHALAHDARELERRPDLGPGNLILRGFPRQERAGIAIGLPLAIDLLGQLELVVLRHLVGELQRGVVEACEELHLFVGFFRDETWNQQAGVVVAIGRVEPQLVAHDGPAEVKADVVVAGELVVAGIEALLPESVGDVVALKRAILPGEQVGAAELVAAGLHHEAERGARALRFRALGGTRHRHLIVGVVVAEKLVPHHAVKLDQLAAGAAVRARAGRR